MAGAPVLQSDCIFCKIASKSTSTPLLYSDEKIVAFQDINPAADRHYLVIPVEHIPTVRDIQKTSEDYTLVNHMLEVGQMLLHRDAPQSLQYRVYITIGHLFVRGCLPNLLPPSVKFGFHQPPFNSVNHLHLHCLTLPYTPRWKHLKFLSLGSLGFLEASKLLEKINPSPHIPSKV